MLKYTDLNIINYQGKIFLFKNKRLKYNIFFQNKVLFHLLDFRIPNNYCLIDSLYLFNTDLITLNYFLLNFCFFFWDYIP